MSAVRVLGVDPGLAITGYACVELAALLGEPRVVEAGAIRLRAGAPLPLRLRQLDEELDALLDELRPTHLVVEQVFTHAAHPRTGVLMAHARGVVLLAGARRALAIDELPPATVKKAMTGRGQATKRQMQLAVMSQCGLADPPEPADVADAIAIAVTGARRLARW
ncbi:MAG TPA: crossover junction endodeoxyribonuclease RuvC [Phycisphaerales bacterium]|nr:crossover junction endodeoxyribonuclease RuvC [Phycisphaerales bacterium]HMP36810.1 crossover junction endodeoxyribonuclease RuvC [Phycisphaerales bacterium]